MKRACASMQLAPQGIGTPALFSFYKKEPVSCLRTTVSHGVWTSSLMKHLFLCVSANWGAEQRGCPDPLSRSLKANPESAWLPPDYPVTSVLEVAVTQGAEGDDTAGPLTRLSLSRITWRSSTSYRGKDSGRRGRTALV